jgi:hypothetical protein
MSSISPITTLFDAAFAAEANVNGCDSSCCRYFDLDGNGPCPLIATIFRRRMDEVTVLMATVFFRDARQCVHMRRDIRIA